MAGDVKFAIEEMVDVQGRDEVEALENNYGTPAFRFVFSHPSRVSRYLVILTPAL
jgi:hypothetical protein